MATLAKTVVGRFAPSPTGSLHLGNMLSLVLAYLSAKHQGGLIVLRIEDLGDGRYEKAIDSCLADLAHLGLQPDCGFGVAGCEADFYRQSRRTACYRAALQKLIALDLVYPCVCPRKYEPAFAPHQGDYQYYDNHCRGRFADYGQATAFLRQHGELQKFPAWRLKTPPEPITFKDELLGARTVDLAACSGDFPIARHPDGAGYQLAVVVDDLAMGVNEVLRGRDLYWSTPWQIYLRRCLAPEAGEVKYLHTPLVVDAQGQRCSKRQGALTLGELFKSGVTPLKLFGLVGYWCKWWDLGREATLKDLLDNYNPATLNMPQVVYNAEVRDYLLG